MDAVVATPETMKAIEDTSLDEAPKVMLPDSQEHGGLPTGAQQ